MDVSKEKSRSSERNLMSIWIEPFRQIKFGLYMIGISLAFILASAILFWSAFNDQYQQLIAIFNVVDPNELWELRLNDVFRTNAIRIIVFFTIFFFVMFYIVFFLTHRYYGPLVSIERFIDDLCKGNYGSRVTIRNKDELQELAQKLNNLAEELEKRHGKNQSKL